MSGDDLTGRFARLWAGLRPIGRDPATGGYLRYCWSEAELACREWLVNQALERGLDVDTDNNGNIWAWWGDPANGDAVVTGSHLDSVPQGGGYDGPLGIVSALLAIDLIREQGLTPTRPVGVVAFAEEEGSRFGLACLGSRLLTGGVEAQRARGLVDRHGVSLAQAMTQAGADPAAIGPDPARLGQLGAFIELHVEQGRMLANLDAPVGVATGIWPHGRWRLQVSGEANHAGTTLMEDRRDPMLTCAYAVLATNKQARLAGAHATIGRIEVTPNATNAVAGSVRAWLDARAATQSTLDQLVSGIEAKVNERAKRDATTVELTVESISPATNFDPRLRALISGVLADPPELPTGAGHDAGVLATAGVPSAMLFVRNPTGVSHAPAERADDADCAHGVRALARVLAELACT